VLHVADERASNRKRKLHNVRTTKGKRGRTVPLHPELIAILEKAPRHADGYLFHGPRGGRIKQDTARTILLRDVIRPLADRFPTPEGEIGFEYGRFHSFRHFFVSQCFAFGRSEGEVKDWVGHRDSAMVAHYRHLHDEISQQSIQRVRFVSDPGRGPADGLPDMTGSSSQEVVPPSIQRPINHPPSEALSHSVSH
jgi:integrase